MNENQFPFEQGGHSTVKPRKMNLCTERGNGIIEARLEGRHVNTSVNTRKGITSHANVSLGNLLQKVRHIYLSIVHRLMNDTPMQGRGGISFKKISSE